MEARRTREPRVLILTVSHGAAHKRVSQALRRALVGINADLTVQVEDTLQHCEGWFRAYYDSYQIPLKYWPGLWGWIESIQHQSQSTGPTWLYRRGARPLFRFIQDLDPDIVIATEVGVCELMAMFKRETKGRFCLVGVTAGVDVDRPWAQPEVDLYPVFPGDPAWRLAAAGVPISRILPCGTPVDPAFSSLGQGDRATIRMRLDLEPDMPLLLVLFGGTGSGKPRRILPELTRVRRPFQVVFITGRSRRQEKSVREICCGVRHFRVLGWVDNVHEWMAAADLLLSKPGGMTVVEAINSSLPLLAFDPLPGAERRACELIEKLQVGYWVRDSGDIRPTIERLLENRTELRHLQERARFLARPRAAYDAAQAILSLWQRGSALR